MLCRLGHASSGSPAHTGAKCDSLFDLISALEPIVHKNWRSYMYLGTISGPISACSTAAERERDTVLAGGSGAGRPPLAPQRQHTPAYSQS